jgi:hypothetical protein
MVDRGTIRLGLIACGELLPERLVLPVAHTPVPRMEWHIRALFALTIGAAAVVIDAGALALGHHAGAGDYAALTWPASSLATIAGGLGAGLESDEAAREAAYRYRDERPSERDSRGIGSVVGESSGQHFVA